MNKYRPGIHLIATLQTEHSGLLLRCEDFRDQIDGLIRQYDLRKLGEVYHNFEPAGFTAVVCLSESHISVHTWPEYNKINLDIYLSNFRRNNDGTVNHIFEALVNYWSASVTDLQKIVR
jgi:S-adenosylmethionine decarboxylase